MEEIKIPKNIPDWAKGVIIVLTTIAAIVTSFEVLMPDYTEDLRDIKQQITEIKQQTSADHDINIVQGESIKAILKRIEALEGK